MSRKIENKVHDARQKSDLVNVLFVFLTKVKRPRPKEGDNLRRRSSRTKVRLRRSAPREGA